MQKGSNLFREPTKFARQPRRLRAALIRQEKAIPHVRRATIRRNAVAVQKMSELFAFPSTPEVFGSLQEAFTNLHNPVVRKSDRIKALFLQSQRSAQGLRRRGGTEAVSADKIVRSADALQECRFRCRSMRTNMFHRVSQ